MISTSPLRKETWVLRRKGILNNDKSLFVPEFWNAIVGIPSTLPFELLLQTRHVEAKYYIWRRSYGNV